MSIPIQPVDHGPAITLYRYPDRSRVVPLDQIVVFVPYSTYYVKMGFLPEIGVVTGQGPKTFQVNRLEIDRDGRLHEGYHQRRAKDHVRRVSRELLVAVIAAAKVHHVYDDEIAKLRERQAEAVRDHLTGYGPELSGATP